MLAGNLLYYGSAQPLPPTIPLRAGPLSLAYERGEVRYVRLGEHELLRRVYVAIRDRNWGTVPPVLSDERIERGADWFRITYQADHVHGEIDFGWLGRIEGDAGGAITFSMAGEARRTFWRNRIGFCVLLPAAAAGAACRVEHGSANGDAARLPEWIAPEQPLPPFVDMYALSFEAAPGQWADLRFEGEVFELEDQRNWTDASFKVFGTPLNLPIPVQVKAGTRLAQSMSLRLRPVPSAAPSAGPTGGALRLALADRRTRLPALGFGCASHGSPLTPREVARLRALRPAHLRIDLSPGAAAVRRRLQQAADEARQLGAGLEVTLTVPEHGGEAMRELAALVGELQPPVVRWLIYPARLDYHDRAPARVALSLARRHLADLLPAVPLAGGADTDFIFINRNPPPVELLDALCVALNPQAHATDNASLVETLPIQAEVVASARALAGGRPVVVSPVTLKPRSNPHATGPAVAPDPRQLPPQVDARQMSLFGAAWTAGSLKHLAASGAASLTYYETTGWRGVMETEVGSPLPECFPSTPGAVFPLYHVLADAAEFRDGEILALKSSDPLQADGLALSLNGRLRMIVANFTGEALVVNLPEMGRARLRRLDEHTASAATIGPEAFRAQPGEALPARVGGATLELRPYAVATLDV